MHCPGGLEANFQLVSGATHLFWFHLFIYSTVQERSHQMPENFSQYFCPTFGQCLLGLIVKPDFLKDCTLEYRAHDLTGHRVSFMGVSDVSDSKESTCNTGELGSIPGLGRSPGGERGNPL